MWQGLASFAGFDLAASLPMQPPARRRASHCCCTSSSLASAWRDRARNSACAGRDVRAEARGDVMPPLQPPAPEVPPRWWWARGGEGHRARIGAARARQFLLVLSADLLGNGSIGQHTLAQQDYTACCLAVP